MPEFEITVDRADNPQPDGEARAKHDQCVITLDEFQHWYSWLWAAFHREIQSQQHFSVQYTVDT